MGKLVALTGNDAVGEAMRQINPDVVAAFPITPQTELMHKFCEYVADGAADTEVIYVESEHSAMSATVGASAAGVRAMTATAANGLALMFEIVYIASSNRLPIVMPVVNRALSGPINIHCDHSDTMGCRDTGWLQIYSENTQEIYDNLFQAVRIAEHNDVLLPIMCTLDGFIISHTMEVLELLPDDVITKFIGEYNPKMHLLDLDNPVTKGPLDLQDYYFEHKRQQVEGMRNAPKVIMDVAKEYEKLSGRKYGLIEEYKTEDADMILIALGSTCGTVKATIDELRKDGKKVGLLKIRVFRPFPTEEIIKVLSAVKAVAVLDRSDSFGAFGGPVYSEIRSAMYDVDKNIPITNYIYGLGGRDIGPKLITKVVNDLEEIIKTDKVKEHITYLGVRE